MDARFENLFSHPSNRIFNIVFFPDRVYHAQYLNATRSRRYRYNVHEVRGKVNAQVLKGQVYLDGRFVCNFLRVEYRGERLVEQTRERGRLLEKGVLGSLKLMARGQPAVEHLVRLEYCPWIDAFQVEVWETLEPPEGQYHDIKVLSMMGHCGSITRVPAFDAALAKPRDLDSIELAFREDRTQFPSGFTISDQDAEWDNFYQRNIQVPMTSEPSSQQNTIQKSNYHLDFQRNFFVADTSQVDPVRYRNAMMSGDHPRRGGDNIVDMRWIFQEELGSNLVFFHEVTIPPGVTEGTHQHIGSEELYYIVSGSGIAYLGENDDPTLVDLPVVQEPIFGLDTRGCREVPVKAGSVILTKSGGIHGIRNPGTTPLVFVAFLYHSV